MTHRFKTQLHYFYFQYYEIPFGIYYLINNLRKREISEDISKYDEIVWKHRVANQITILDNKKMNEIGNSYLAKNNKIVYKTALSKTWYQRKKKDNPEMIEQVRNNLSNYFKNKPYKPSGERLWTCFVSEKEVLKSKNVNIGCWEAFNCRATNKWGNRKYLAYLINRYLDPSYQLFFNQNNIKLDGDQNALSELIQWIWRSRIRNFEDIEIYIPSFRMRNLLKEFLGMEVEKSIISRRL